MLTDSANINTETHAVMCVFDSRSMLSSLIMHEVGGAREGRR